MKLKVRVLAAVAVVVGPLFVGTPGASAATAQVGLFSDANYGGCAYYVYGTTSIPHFGNLVYGNTDPASCKTKSLGDSVSSVSNGRCTIRLYVDGGYSGAYQQIAPYTVVPQVTYNDKYSSLKFFC